VGDEDDADYEGANIGGERIVGLDRYRWFYDNRTPISVSYVWLCRYSDRTRWPLSIHQWGMTVVHGAEGPPNPEGAMNGFGVVYAIGPLTPGSPVQEVPVAAVAMVAPAAKAAVSPATAERVATVATAATAAPVTSDSPAAPGAKAAAAERVAPRPRARPGAAVPMVPTV
jgi:hypothetical protein